MSFKVKLGVVGFIIVVVLTILLVVLTMGPFGPAALTSVESAVSRAASVAPSSQRLYAYDLLGQVKGFALRKEFVAAIQESEGDKRRIAVYDAINELDKALAAKNRKPGFLGVVDNKGVIIARDLDPNADHGDRLPYPVVPAVLGSGRASTSLWMMKDRMMRAAVAPLVVQGQVAGALAIAYDFTSAEARQDALQFGTHVAYFMGGAVRASSFTAAGESNTEDAAMVGALSQSLGDEAKRAIESNKGTDLLDVVIQGETFKAVVGPLPTTVMLVDDGETAPHHKLNVGFVVLSSLDRAMAPVKRARLLLVGFGILFLLLVLGLMWLVAQHFVKAEDHLELGVNEMINGNVEYTFEVLGEFEGLANALNVLLSRLLGRPEPGEDEEGENWRADVIFVEDLAPDSAGSELARQLAAEPDDQYYSRLFQEYVEARKRAGLPVEGITLDGLARKLRANEAMLKAKHKCQMVRFSVKTSGGKVSFEPVQIG